MIAARKSRWFSALFGWEAERRIRRHFGAVSVRGIADLKALASEGPVLVVSNHTAWWDPLFLIYLLVRRLDLDAYALMDARNLARLPFFGRLGAFGADLEDPADGARAIRYAARLLDRPGRVVWIFAQGDERPVTAKPLGFRAGAAAIARLAAGAAVVPAALRYAHGTEPAPSALLSLGAPLGPERDLTASTATQEEAVSRELDRIDGALCRGDTAGFLDLYRRSPGWGFAAAQRALGWLVGRR